MNLFAAASSSLPRFVAKGFVRAFIVPMQAATLLLLAGITISGYGQEANTLAVQTVAPVKVVHVMRPQSGPSDATGPREQFRQRSTASANVTPLNTGSGITYTCDPTVSASVCTYLNTTVASYYNTTFTNANANIYIQFGTTGLAESTQYYNIVTYADYVSALSSISSPSAVQTSALSALSTYDATPYGSGNVEVTVALARALGFPASGLFGITASEASCTPGASGCYNGIITVTNDPSTPLYYDTGGAEPSDAYDFYGAVQHETDELLGTSSCVYSSGEGLVDGCDFAGTGTPSAVDLFRYSAPHDLILDSAPSTTAGAYFSYNGGTSNGVNGAGGTPKFYNTLDNGADYADFAFISDCGANIAIQDAFGCPGEDAGLTIHNDGGGEIKILNAVGFSVPSTTETPATITSPTPGSTLPATGATFTWTTASGATGYILSVGTTGAGSYNLYYSGSVTGTSATVSSLPTNGGTIYVRLTTNFSGTWMHVDYTYAAAAQSALTAPTPGSRLAGTSAKFMWTTVSGATGYILSVGTTGAGSYNLYYSGSVTTTSATVNNLPTNGATIYARLTTEFGGTWVHTDYTYTATSLAAMTSPTPSSTLTGSSVTFSWTTVSGATGYILSVGTTGAGSYNLDYSGSITATSATVSNLPTNGGTIYVRLTTNFNGTWVHTDYTYTAAKIAAMTSPTPGSTLTGASVKFTWTTAPGATGYILSLGTTGAGSYNLYYSGSITATSVTVNNLPTNGATIYARLTTNFNGTWVHTDYTYTAAP
jgi:hypothetical protein